MIYRERFRVAKRKKMKAILDPLIPEFSVRLGGATSIDVTKPASTRPTGSGSFATSSGSPSKR